MIRSPQDVAVLALLVLGCPTIFEIWRPGGPVLRSPAHDRNAESSKVLRKFNSDRVQKCQKTDKIVKFDRINQV